ncbi:MAG: ATP-dependent DNA ligase [Methanospirillum sp.]|uniref:ATP-dependent DNA ligase n=1 Tax=Methanospirillum sp. TaxID=45200 RepID=UPI0023693B3A|nr:ATP-dependent DNA ligase [Methanospirillum sp.]MDD1729755.1 ATP-dependent DNA ligase [Methanospirillum sp.]
MKFLIFAELCNRIESIKGRLDTIEILSGAIKDVDLEDLAIFVRLILGKPFPDWSPMKLGIGPNLLYESIAYVTGKNRDGVIKRLNSVGDLGKAVEEMLANKSQTSFFAEELTLTEVYAAFEAISRAEGGKSQKERLRIIHRLFSVASPIEGHYITGILLDDMRIGVGEGNVRDAVAKAFGVDSSLVEHAQQVLNDMGEVAVLALLGQEALSQVKMQIFHPVRMMLARQGTISQVISDSGAIAVEYKYDGARFQFHKKGGDARMYSRRLEEVTDALPDVVSMLLGATDHDLILDGEVIAVKDDRPMPFQTVLKRFRRKHGVADAVDAITLVPNVFDILYLDGEMLLDRPFSERREILTRVLQMYATPQLVSDDPAAIEAYYQHALDDGHEGVMLKLLGSRYTPGMRGKDWVKIKPEVDTLDLVVVGAEWGEGKRAHVYGSFLVAARQDDRLVPVSRVATGLSDDQLTRLYETLKDTIMHTEEKMVYFEPALVFEIGYSEIQQSPNYEGGFALRFPRFVQVRDDKDIREANTLEDIRERYEMIQTR